MISDNHLGLVNAIKRHFTGTTWQRCQTHFSRNILDATPKAIQSELKDALRGVYEASDLEQARHAKLAIIKTYEHQAPRPCKSLTKRLMILQRYYHFPNTTAKDLEQLME